MAFTSSNLLSSISRRSFAPTGQATFTSSELLELADEETKTSIVPSIMAVREEFFVFYKRYIVTAGISAYRIPPRAIGLSAREIQLLNGNSSTDLPKINPEDVRDYGSGGIESFYIVNNNIYLYRVPTSSGAVLLVPYFLRPGNLVLPEYAAIVDTIDLVTNTVTVTTIPAAWVTGNRFDFIRQDGGHESVDIDLTSTLISGTSITLSSVPTSLEVGDYIALSGQTPVVQLPPDYHPILAQAVAAQILDDMNQPGADKASKRLEKMLESVQTMVSPRVQGAPTAFIHEWF